MVIRLVASLTVPTIIEASIEKSAKRWQKIEFVAVDI